MDTNRFKRKIISENEAAQSYRPLPQQKPAVVDSQLSQTPIEPNKETSAPVAIVQPTLNSSPDGTTPLQSSGLKQRSLPIAKGASFYIGVLIFLIIGGLLTTGVVVWYRDRSEPAKTIHAGTSQILPLDVPNYTPVEPQADVAAGTVPKGTFSAAAETYGFFDTYEGHKLQVTEQAQLSKYKSIQQEVTSIATTSGVTNLFDVTGGTAYYSTDNGAGVQTVLAPVKDLLITIQSVTPLSANQWEQYVNSLQ